jgi:hypothetical protein
MNTLSEKEFKYSDLLICLSKNLFKLKNTSQLSPYKKLKNLIIKPTYILNEKLMITHKVYANDSIIIRAPMKKQIHYKIFIKNYFSKE